MVYFYSKASTQGQELRDLCPPLKGLGAEIIGISRDSLRRHTSVAAEHDMRFPLAVDPDETACAAYGVLKEKTNRQGKTVHGVVRSTCVIGGAGMIRIGGYGVKAQGPAAEVLERGMDRDG